VGNGPSTDFHVDRFLSFVVRSRFAMDRTAAICLFDVDGTVTDPRQVSEPTASASVCRLTSFIVPRSRSSRPSGRTWLTGSRGERSSDWSAVRTCPRSTNSWAAPNVRRELTNHTRSRFLRPTVRSKNTPRNESGPTATRFGPKAKPPNPEPVQAFQLIGFRLMSRHKSKPTITRPTL